MEQQQHQHQQQPSDAPSVGEAPKADWLKPIAPTKISPLLKPHLTPGALTDVSTFLLPKELNDTGKPMQLLLSVEKRIVKIQAKDGHIVWGIEARPCFPTTPTKAPTHSLCPLRDDYRFIVDVYAGHHIVDRLYWGFPQGSPLGNDSFRLESRFNAENPIVNALIKDHGIRYRLWASSSDINVQMHCMVAFFKTQSPPEAFLDTKPMFTRLPAVSTSMPEAKLVYLPFKMDDPNAVVPHSLPALQKDWRKAQFPIRLTKTPNSRVSETTLRHDAGLDWTWSTMDTHVTLPEFANKEEKESSQSQGVTLDMNDPQVARMFHTFLQRLSH